MTTPPTPAEVAEARAWFRRYPDEVSDVAIARACLETRSYAAVLVRAALAASAEQPREDSGRIADVVHAALDAAGVECEEPDDDPVCFRVARAVASSASPSAVPAASAGGAGRDLTAQDIDAAIHPPGPEDYRYYAADYLNAIARPAATGTQATEQTTEYRVVLTSNRKSYASATGDSGLTDLLDTFKKSINSGALTIEQRSVSPWSPVAVHDENGAQA